MVARVTRWNWGEVNQTLIERLRKAIKECPGVKITLSPERGMYEKGSYVPLKISVEFDEDFHLRWPALIRGLAEQNGLQVWDYIYKLIIKSKGIPFEDALERFCDVFESFLWAYAREVLVVDEDTEDLVIQ